MPGYGPNRSIDAAASRRRGAFWLSALFVASLLLPTLHLVASGGAQAGGAAHHGERCAQCDAFAQVRTGLPATPLAIPSVAPFGPSRVLAHRSAELASRLADMPGSPRSPPTSLSLS